MSAQPIPAPQHDPAIQAILDRLKSRGVDLAALTQSVQTPTAPQPEPDILGARRVEVRGDLLELDPTIQRGPDDIGGGPDPFPGPTGQAPRARTKLEEMQLLFAVPAVGAATGLNQILLNAANLADGGARIIERRTGLERGKGFEVVAGWLKEQVEAGVYTLETLPKPDTFAEHVVTAVGTGALMLPVFAVPKAISSVAGLPVLGAISGSDRGLSGALEGAAFFAYIDRFIKGMAPATRTLRGTSVAVSTYLFERAAGRSHDEAMVAASALGIFGAANRPILRDPIRLRELPVLAAERLQARLGKGEIAETPPSIEKQIDVLDRMLASEDVAEVRFAERELAAMEGRLVEEPQDVTRLFDEIEAADAAPRAQPTEKVPGTVIRVEAPAPAEPVRAEPVAAPRPSKVKLGRMIDDIREGVKEPPNLPKRPILEILKQKGGVDPDSPLATELELAGVPKRGPGSSPGLFRKGGMTALDKLELGSEPLFQGNLRAEVEGREILDPRQVLKSIYDEAHGQPLRTQAEIDRITRFQSERQELAAELDAMDVDVRGQTNPQIIARLERVSKAAERNPEAPANGSDLPAGPVTRRVYHGTTSGSAIAASGLKRAKGGDYDGFYFTDSRAQALEWAGQHKGQRAALDYEISLQSPASFSDVTAAKAALGEGWTPKQLTAELKRRGFDGVVDDSFKGNEVVVFEEAQFRNLNGPTGPREPPPKPPPGAGEGPPGPRAGGGGQPPRRPTGGGRGIPEPGPEPLVSFKTGNRVAIDPPREVTVEEITAKLTELQAQGLSPETAIDYLLSKSDLTLGDSAGRILPAVIEFYRPQIEQLRRGVMPDQHVRELAQMMGMTEEQLVSRRIGQPMDAPTAMAARDLVARQLAIVDGALDRATRGGPREEIMFEQELAKLQIFYSQLRGAVSEMGRAFRILRMPAEAERAAGGRLRFEDLPELMAGMRGEQPTRVLIRKLNKLRSEPFSQRGMMRESVNARTVDKVLEFYRAWLLQGPRTLARNFAGNAAFAIMAPLETEFSATLGRMIRKSPFQDLDIPLLRRLSRVRQDAEKLKRIDDMFEKGIVDERIYQGEGFAQLYGQVQAGRVALQLFWRGLVGVPGEGVGMARGIFQLPKRLFLTERAPPSIDSKTERRPGGAIGGTTGTIIRTPFRVLEAFDEGFRYPAVQGKLHQLGYRVAAKQGLHGKELVHAIQDFVAEPPQWAAQKARAFGREAIFTEPLGFRGRAVRNVVKAFPGTLEPLFLFQRTPINLLKSAGRRSPLALMMSDVKEDLDAGGARADLARGRIAMGTGIALYIMHLANAGLITGAGSDDPKRRAVEWELGWRPYSVLLKIPERLGGNGQWTYYGYRGMEPASQHLGVVADIVEGYHRLNDQERNLGFALIGASFINNTLDMSMMASLSGMIEAIGSPERNMDRFVNNFVASGIQPRLLAPFYEKADPMIRDARTMLQSVQTRLGLGNSEFDTFGIGPGLKLIPAKLSYWGQDRKRDKFIPGVGPLSGVTPFRISPKIEDKPSSESLRLGVFLEMPDRKIGLVELTPWEYWEMAGKARRNAKRTLDIEMSKPYWDKLSTSEEGRFIQREVIRTTILSWQQITRAQAVGRMKRADQFRAFLDRDLATLFQRSQGVTE